MLISGGGWKKQLIVNKHGGEIAITRTEELLLGSKI